MPKKGISPKSAGNWEQMPAVPSLAFKKFILTSFPVEKAEHAYFTSGTTDYKKKSKIYRDKGAVKLVTEANGLLTRLYLFPDVEKMKILLMVPSPKMARNMGEIGIDHSVGHRGGRVATQILAYVMRRKMSKIGKIYARLK